MLLRYSILVVSPGSDPLSLYIATRHVGTSVPNVSTEVSTEGQHDTYQGIECLSLLHTTRQCCLFISCKRTETVTCIYLYHVHGICYSKRALSALAHYHRQSNIFATSLAMTDACKRVLDERASGLGRRWRSCESRCNRDRRVRYRPIICYRAKHSWQSKQANFKRKP